MILRQKIKWSSVSRLKKKLDTKPQFLSQFLTTREIRYCTSKRHVAESAAARHAAKLALLSLFRIPEKHHSKWMHHIEIMRKNDSKPFFKLSAVFKKKLRMKKNQILMLSLAHERNEAVAWVALVEKGIHA